MSKNINNETNLNLANLTNWNENKLQKYVALLTVGYFGVKIFYGIFKKYQKKPMKDEMISFSVMIVMGCILYLFTNIQNRNLFGRKGFPNLYFFFGYLLGLNIPFLLDTFVDLKKNIQNLQYIFYALFVIILVIMLYLSFRTSSDFGTTLYFGLYLIVIGIIIIGIIITRKRSKIYSTTKYDKEGKNVKHGFIETAGQDITFTVPMIGWLLSLIFMYDAEESILFRFLSFFNGIFIAMFVSGVSFYGFPYILSDSKEKEWDLKNECPKNQIMDKEYVNVTTSLSTIKWVLAFTLIILIVTIILFYMVRS